MTDEKSKGIHDTGFNYDDAVIVPDEGANVNGIVSGFLAGGKKMVVRIGHPGHKNHGRNVTVDVSDVKAVPAANPAA